MGKHFGIFLLLVLFFIQLSAQNNSISLKGSIKDSINNKPLYKAVVNILSSKDSMLVRYVRTDIRGQFEISGLQAGKYLLLSTFPRYADYVDTFSITGKGFIETGTISMISRAHLLEEVIVKQSMSAIKMKGDTTEYKVDSFWTQPNQSIEDLLRKLPGFQVDKNGRIFALGQKIQKVLVDGEEFFGDDPTLVTQNIRAAMVDKIQIYDKKSDQAVFTGIDDGQKTKTINLKLKNDKKNGSFGKIELSKGTNDFYNEQSMYNRFRSKEKLSFFQINSNIGTTGLNSQDQSNYGDNSTSLQVDENGNDPESWGVTFNGQGLPSVRTGGAHYNNKWGNDKQSINANIKIQDQTVSGFNTNNAQYLLPDTSYYYNLNQSFINSITRNKGNSVYDIDLDSTSSLKLVIEAGLDHKTSRNNFVSQSLDKNFSFINQGSRQIFNVSEVNYFNGSFLWRKKMRRQGQTFSVYIKEVYSLNTYNGFLKSENDFYRNGFQFGTQSIDQLKTSKSSFLTFDVKLTYSQPLTKVASLVFNYGISVNNNSSNRNSYNKSSGGQYDILDSIYSNNYIFNVLCYLKTQSMFDLSQFSSI